jgi:hypothetical protein
VGEELHNACGAIILCSISGYDRSGRTYCLHVQGRTSMLKKQSAHSPETFIHTEHTVNCHISEAHNIECCRKLRSYATTFFSLWLYSSILGLGRLHETFCFISVTRSRPVSRTPWTGDQLVSRPLLRAPGDCEDGAFGGMNGFVRGN